VKLTVDAASLREAILSARAAVPNNPSLIAQAGVLLEAHGQHLTVTGSDNTTLISARVEADVETEGNALVIPRALVAWLSQIRCTTVTLSLSGSDLQVRPESGKAYSFRCLDAALALPAKVVGAATQADLAELALAVARVKASAGRDTPKDNPLVQLVSDASGLTLNTTDSFRLASCHLPGAGFGDHTLVLPLAVVDRMARMEGLAHAQVIVGREGQALRISTASAVVQSAVLSTSFPRVDSVLSVRPPLEIRFNAEEAKVALARLESLAGTAPMKVLVDERLTFEVRNVDVGTGSEEVEVRQGLGVPFAFNVKLAYLSAALDAVAPGEVTMRMTSTTQAVYLHGGTSPRATCVVMPMRS
jgi:DNA polymerase III subunit beta